MARKKPLGRGLDARTGRSKRSGPFTLVDHGLYDSLAFQSLKPGPRAIYWELARRYNGRNNGHIVGAVRELAKRCHMSKDTVGRCLKELIEKGLIECTSVGAFNIKDTAGSEWRLTVYKCDKTNELRTRRFNQWRPTVLNEGTEEALPKNISRSQTRDTTVLNEGTQGAENRSTVLNEGTETGVSHSITVLNEGTHIESTIGGAASTERRDAINALPTLAERIAASMAASPQSVSDEGDAIE